MMKLCILLAGAAFASRIDLQSHFRSETNETLVAEIEESEAARVAHLETFSGEMEHGEALEVAQRFGKKVQMSDEPDINEVWGCAHFKKQDGKCPYMGVTDTAELCSAACLAADDCQAFTWHEEGQQDGSEQWQKQCYFVLNSGTPAGRSQTMHVSGRKTTATDPCRKRKHRTLWVGTAPFCGGHAGDCKARGMTVRMYCGNCDGQLCLSGTKVQCETWDDAGWDDECDMECSSAYRREFVGTAPHCGGNDCDCLRSGMVPLKLSGSYACPCEKPYRCTEFGSGCQTGAKVLCAAPKQSLPKLTAAIQRARDDCTKRDDISGQNKRAMMSAATELAKTGAQALAAAGR